VNIINHQLTTMSKHKYENLTKEERRLAKRNKTESITFKSSQNVKLPANSKQSASERACESEMNDLYSAYIIPSQEVPKSAKPIINSNGMSEFIM
jgi:hypothetical protein